MSKYRGALRIAFLLTPLLLCLGCRSAADHGRLIAAAVASPGVTVSGAVVTIRPVFPSMVSNGLGALGDVAPEVEELYLECLAATPADSRALPRMPALRKVVFDRCIVTEGTLAALAERVSPGQVHFYHCRLPASLANELSDMRSIRAIWLGSCGVTDSQLAPILNLARVHFFFIGDEWVTGECFRAVPRGRRPYRLCIERCSNLGRDAGDILRTATVGNPDMILSLVDCSLTMRDIFGEGTMQPVTEADAAPRE